MGQWTYEGLDNKGKRTTGKIDAKSDKEARKLLRAKGIRPKKIKPPSILEFDLGEWMVEKGFAKSFGAKELTNFTKQLSIMVNAGVPILQAIEILVKQEKNASLKKAIKSIHSAVAEGKTLSEAMFEQKGFSRLYCNLVKAGEAGGILDTILDKLAGHMEKQEKTKAQLKSAMTYPALVTVIGTGVVWGLMVFVVPQFQEMLADTGQEMPAITAFVINVSNFLQEWTLTIAPIIFVALIMLWKYIQTPAGKIIFDKVSMNMPIFGGVIIKGNLSSFFRTLSTLLSSGVALIDSLDICIETLDNRYIAGDFEKVRKGVTEGKTLTDPLTEITYFPDMVAQMIRVGEQTGSIDSMLSKISIVFEEEVDNLVSGMTKMIEPIILVVLGGIIAVVLVAMYLPIFMSAGGGV